MISNALFLAIPLTTCLPCSSSMSLIHIVVSVTTHKKTFSEYKTLCKKVTKCYYRKPDLSMIFVIIFFRTHWLPRRNYFVAEFQEICKISEPIHGQVRAAFKNGRDQPHRLNNARL